MRKVEVEWSRSERGTTTLVVPDDADDDQIIEVLFDGGYTESPDRTDWDYEIFEVKK